MTTSGSSASSQCGSGGEIERERHLAELREDLERARDLALEREKLAVTGTLAAATAHDIRNILSALALDLEAAEGSAEDRLRAVKRHFDRFNVLAHRLLSYAKPGRVTLARMSGADSVDRVLQLLSGHLAISRVVPRVDVPRDLPRVLADAGRFDHLLVNLVLNAIQATTGGGTLDVAARVEGPWITVEVVDDGPGIPPEALARIFQPFSSTRVGGFGLGLYSCREIARECGGTVEAENLPVRGARVTVRIPSQ